VTRPSRRVADYAPSTLEPKHRADRHEDSCGLACRPITSPCDQYVGRHRAAAGGTLFLTFNRAADLILGRAR
jgi:hypothetical protein